MNEEEKLSLNNYIDDLYQAMQIGDIVFEPKHSSELYNLINKLQQELQKYKSLYENEKDHTDTLKRIINNVSENIYNLIDECNSIIGNKESSIVSKNQLMIMQREELTKILDLLKEIK